MTRAGHQQVTSPPISAGKEIRRAGQRYLVLANQIPLTPPPFFAIASPYGASQVVDSSCSSVESFPRNYTRPARWHYRRSTPRPTSRKHRSFWKRRPRGSQTCISRRPILLRVSLQNLAWIARAYKSERFDTLGGSDLGSPLLSVGDWNIYHAGIRWRKGSEGCGGVIYKRYMNADLLLAFQAVDPLKALGQSFKHTLYDTSITDGRCAFTDRSSCLKIKVVQDKVLRTLAIPKSLRTKPLKLIHCDTVGRWSDQTITCCHDHTSTIKMKLEPRSDPDDKGIYFIKITLQQESKLCQLDPSLARFDFHLKGSNIGNFCAWVRRLWCRPSVSQRIDTKRTRDIAELDLPFLEQ